MARPRMRLLLATSAVIALCSLAAMPAAAEVDEQFAKQLFAVEKSTDLIAVCAVDTDTSALVSVEPFERLPESPGGVIAKVTSETEVTDNEKEVLPGGAAGVASIGIRGPTIA